jgi:hypothetical protein
MPSEKDSVLWVYDSGDDGQIAAGTVTSPWFDARGLSKVLVQGVVANSTGTTAVHVDQSHRNSGTQEVASADQFASLGTGAEVNVSGRYVRLRIVQATAATTNVHISMKGSD